MESNFFIIPGDSTDNKVNLFDNNHELTNLSFNNIDINIDESNNIINLSAGNSIIPYSDLSTSSMMGGTQITDVLLKSGKYAGFFSLTTTIDPVVVNLTNGFVKTVSADGHTVTFNYLMTQEQLNNSIRDAFFTESDNVKYNIADGNLLIDFQTSSTIYTYTKIISLSVKNIKSALVYFIGGNLTSSTYTFPDNVVFTKNPDTMIISDGHYDSYLCNSSTFSVNIIYTLGVYFSFLYNPYVIGVNMLTSGDGIRSYPSVIELPASNFDILYDTSGLTTYVDIIFNIKYSKTTTLNMNVKVDSIIKLTKTINYTANQIIAFMIRILKNSKGEINCYMLN